MLRIVPTGTSDFLGTMAVSTASLSRRNLNLDRANHRRTRGLRRFEVQFQRFLQVGESLSFGFALASDIDFQALGDVPLPLAPNGRGEWSLHDHILSDGNRPSHARCVGSMPSR